MAFLPCLCCAWHVLQPPCACCLSAYDLQHVRITHPPTGTLQKLGASLQVHMDIVHHSPL